MTKIGGANYASFHLRGDICIYVVKYIAFLKETTSYSLGTRKYGITVYSQQNSRSHGWFNSLMYKHYGNVIKPIVTYYISGYPRIS